MDQNEFQCVIENACPGAGACGGICSNTMASALKLWDFALIIHLLQPSGEKFSDIHRIGSAMKYLIENDVK